MTTTMMVAMGIAMWVIGIVGFLAGSAYSTRTVGAKIDEMEFTVDHVINALRVKLITENDNRGFQTRTHVSAWLRRMGPEVKEEIYSGANHGRKTM